MEPAKEGTVETSERRVVYQPKPGNRGRTGEE